MGALEDAVAALDREPSRERAAEVLRQLASSFLSEKQVARILAHAADRVMSALATRATIRFDSPQIAALFVRWPAGVRAGFEITLPDAPLWEGDCPRCDRELQTGHDSYGLSTYTRLYRCNHCGWRDEQPTQEETLASMYSRMHEEEAQAREALERTRRARARVERILAATYDVPEGCFPLHIHQVENGDPLPSPLDQLTPWVSGISVRDGHAVDVRLDATVFLERGRELRSHSPFRSALLLNADGHETEIFQHPTTAELEGLKLGTRHGDEHREALLDALITAPPLPRLRHLAIDDIWLDRAALEALVVAPIAAALRCFHVQLTGLIDSDPDEDDFPASWVNDHGKAMFALAEQYPFLEPALASYRKMFADQTAAIAATPALRNKT